MFGYRLDLPNLDRDQLRTVANKIGLMSIRFSFKVRSILIR